MACAVKDPCELTSVRLVVLVIRATISELWKIGNDLGTLRIELGHQG
jgi:hypothetical protein